MEKKIDDQDIIRELGKYPGGMDPYALSKNLGVARSTVYDRVTTRITKGNRKQERTLEEAGIVEVIHADSRGKVGRPRTTFKLRGVLR